MKVRITQAAQADLEQIWEYSAENWVPEQAGLYIDRLMLRFAWLTANTDLWHARHDIGDGVCSCAETSHVIFFSGTNDNITILRVLHGRMDPAGRVG